MSMRVDEFSKTGHDSGQVDNGLSGNKSGQGNIFQALLNMLKPQEGATAPNGGFRNRPATSQVIGYGLQGLPASHTLQNVPVSPQSVNSLAASTLIAMSAVSSGANGLSGLCGQGTPMPAGLTGLVPATGGAGQGSAFEVEAGQGIGALSARFESGDLGPGAVGYDPNGGTSYGTYQISSRMGTMKLFINYLSQCAPDLAEKLQAAGPANTGSRAGTMPQVWKELADADPVRFQKLQTGFIKESFYLPSVQEISAKTGMDISTAPKALQEVLWSTVVQHGAKGAADIFTRAIRSVQGNNEQGGMAKLINTVYDMRANRFASSGSGVRASVTNRFREEGRIALSMLTDENSEMSNMRG